VKNARPASAASGGDLLEPTPAGRWPSALNPPGVACGPATGHGGRVAHVVGASGALASAMSLVAGEQRGQRPPLDPSPRRGPPAPPGSGCRTAPKWRFARPPRGSASRRASTVPSWSREGIAARGDSRTASGEGVAIGVLDDTRDHVITSVAAQRAADNLLLASRRRFMICAPREPNAGSARQSGRGEQQAAESRRLRRVVVIYTWSPRQPRSPR
jgi:hypothetical protein